MDFATAAITCVIGMLLLMMISSWNKQKAKGKAVLNDARPCKHVVQMKVECDKSEESEMEMDEDSDSSSGCDDGASFNSNSSEETGTCFNCQHCFR